MNAARWSVALLSIVTLPMPSEELAATKTFPEAISVPIEKVLAEPEI